MKSNETEIHNHLEEYYNILADPNICNKLSRIQYNTLIKQSNKALQIGRTLPNYLT